jgi:hypothetical protein
MSIVSDAGLRFYYSISIFAGVPPFPCAYAISILEPSAIFAFPTHAKLS